MSSLSGGSSVYSLTKHHDDKVKRRERRKKQKSEAKSTTKVEVIMEEDGEMEAQNMFKTQEGNVGQSMQVTQREEEKLEMEALGMISSCISDMSCKYE